MNLKKTSKKIGRISGQVSQYASAAMTACVLLVVAQPAFALNGGFDSATSTVSDFKTWLYTIAAVVVVIMLLYKALQCMGGKAQWSEYGTTIMYAAIAGGSIVFGANAFSWFSGG
jgi:type IV secretory pathway VirB2 component (pilin)